MAGRSPEEVAPSLGVAGNTVRSWLGTLGTKQTAPSFSKIELLAERMLTTERELRAMLGVSRRRLEAVAK